MSKNFEPAELRFQVSREVELRALIGPMLGSAAAKRMVISVRGEFITVACPWVGDAAALRSLMKLRSE
jgi:hypothetical protein